MGWLHLRFATIILLTISVLRTSSQKDDELVDDAEIPKPPALKPEKKIESKIHEKPKALEESPQLSEISDNGHKKKAEASEIKAAVHNDKTLDNAGDFRNASKDEEQKRAAESVKPSKPGDKTENKFGKKLETKEKVDLKDGGDDVMEQSLEKMKDEKKMVNAKEDGTNSNTNKHKLGEKPIEATSEENEREKMEAEARKKFTQHKEYDLEASNNHSTFADGRLVIIVIIVLAVIYGLIHNRKKILGLIVEGKSGRRSTLGRRTAGSNVRYRKLNTDDVEQRNYIS